MTYDEVRARIDEALGSGSGLGAREAWDRLSNVERAVWLLDELRVLATGSIHVHSQQYMTNEAFDGPPLLARLGGEVRALDPEVADFCQWVAERGRRDRREGVNESFVSVVNLVGDVVAPSFERVVSALAASWPDDRALESLPAPPDWRKEVRAPARSTPRFPGVALDVGAWARRGPQLLTSAVVHALWRAGASDETLDAVRDDLGRARDDMAETIATWIPFAGDREALRAVLFPAHPIDAIVEERLDPFFGLVWISDERFESAAASLKKAGFQICVPGEHGDALTPLRAALRMDPEGIVVRARDFEGPDGSELVFRAAAGSVVVVSGTTPAFETALAALPPGALRLLDRR